MAKRQSNESVTVQNVVRVDGEGKIHANGGKIDPLCKLRGHADHSWERTTDAVDCQRCINLVERREENRKRLEYATRVTQSQEPGSQHLHPMEDARPVEPFYSEGALRDLDIMAKGEPKNGVPVPRAEFTSEGVKVLDETPAYFQTPKSSAIPAVTPIMDSEGEPITVPVDYDNPEAGRRELDASKGERVLSESTYRQRESVEHAAKRENERMEYVRRVEALRQSGNMSPESIHALIRELQGMVSEAPETEGFSVTFHEPKNGPALECEIPPIPAGVNPNTWELAHQGNTEGARRYHMRQAEAQEAAYREHVEAMEESRKAVENDTPPF